MGITTLPLEHLLASTSSAEFSARRQLSDVSTSIAKAKRVVVVSGAGISCSSGIPDFRSADGLYALVKSRYPDTFFSGKDLFSSGLFNDPRTTAIFYTFIAELSLACEAAQPTRTHHFIHKLEKTGKLLRSYTQNVDGLERRLGLESDGRGKGLKKKGTRNVELHGDLGRVRCTLCFEDFEKRDEWVSEFREGVAPDCPKCLERCASRLKRSARATSIGTLRPSIVLYDEPHPLGDDIGLLQTYDLSRQPDVLLIMGTSLKVHGLKRLVKDFARAVRSGSRGQGRKGLVIFVNATAPGKEWEGVIDFHIHGTTDRWVERVEEEWRRVKPGDWEVQTRLDGEMGQVGHAASVGKDDKAAKGKAKAKAPKPASLFNGQLPTPRPSTSPSRASTKYPARRASQPGESTSASSSPLTPLSPSVSPVPLSPSKRGANLTPDASPTKRTKVIPPPTGMPSTPGRGNLFAGLTDHMRVSTAADPGAEEEVFGSPRKPIKEVAWGRKAGKENREPEGLVIGSEAEDTGGKRALGARKTARAGKGEHLSVGCDADEEEVQEPVGRNNDLGKLTGGVSLGDGTHSLARGRRRAVLAEIP